MTLTIDPHGTLRCLYTEAIPLGEIGRLHIVRASRVEPDEQGQWYADIVDGPLLGPYPTRSAALQAEVAHIEANTL